MRRGLSTRFVLLLAIFPCLTVGPLGHGQDTPAHDAGLGRMSIDKQFHGDLEGTSKGFMLASAAAVVKGSGGYVAMERVTGTLKGRTGSFVLQHSGTMTRGTPQLSVTVVPDSGSGEARHKSGTHATHEVRVRSRFKLEMAQLTWRSSACAMASLGLYPTICSTTCPPLKTSSVGMPVTL